MKSLWSAKQISAIFNISWVTALEQVFLRVMNWCVKTQLSKTNRRKGNCEEKWFLLMTLSQSRSFSEIAPMPVLTKTTTSEVYPQTFQSWPVTLPCQGLRCSYHPPPSPGSSCAGCSSAVNPISWPFCPMWSLPLSVVGPRASLLLNRIWKKGWNATPEIRSPKSATSRALLTSFL